MAAARPSPRVAEPAEVGPAPDPREILATADEVLVEHDATGYLLTTLPEGEIRLRGLAVRLAHEVRRLLGRV